jgi:hypothetical protein
VKSYLHDHITQEVVRIGAVRKLPYTQRPTRCFAATLRDGTYLPCVTAAYTEDHTMRVTPETGEPFLQFHAASMGQACYSACIIHGDYVQSVEPSPYLLPEHLSSALATAEFKDCYSLRVQMRSGVTFTIASGGELLFFRPPEGYSWLDVVNTSKGFDHSPERKISPMVAFRCFLTGLPDATIRDA